MAPAGFVGNADAPPPVDWPRLRTEAAAVASRAYAPYSGLRVGAAAITADGDLLTGCNVENASFGLTLCAECGLVSALHAQSPAGGARLVAVAVVAGDGMPLSPCGRCRQLLAEAGGPDLLVDGGEGRPPVRLDDLLPGAFWASDLEARRDLATAEPARRDSVARRDLATAEPARRDPAS